MRILVSHATTYRYEQPAKSVVQLLRLTPRHHESQYVVRWRIDLSHDCRMDQREDAFGNILHAFTVAGPVEELRIEVAGEVETQEAYGVVRGAIERFPTALYLRETPLTEPDAAIAELAHSITAEESDTLKRLHRLLAAVHKGMAFDTNPTQVHTTAAQAFALKRGVCQDLSHVFIAAARRMDIPARYVSGHLRRADNVVDQEAGHAWTEAYVPDLGWVGFDPANGISVSEGHVRIATGLDYLGAAPVRGARYGGAEEKLSVSVRVAQAGEQVQS